MTGLLQVEVLPGETRAFLWQGDRLAGLAVERGDGALRGGDRAVGRVRALDRRLQAAFITLPAGADGLLPFNALAGLSEGQAVAVRVSRAASEGKGPKLAIDRETTAADLAAGPVPRLVAQGAGALEVLLTPGLPVECDDAGQVRALQAAGATVRFLPQGFPPAEQARQDEAVEQALDPTVPLAGGNLLIEVGRTLTAIDVNLGSAEPRGFNALAAGEIARQLQLRQLAGRFVVDFLADARDEDKAIQMNLRSGFAFDAARHKLIGWSRGGLFEFTRRRVGAALHETLLEPAAYGGWRKRPLTLALEAVRTFDRARRAQPAVRQALVVRPDLLALLRPHPALDWLAARVGRPVPLRAGGPDPWRLEAETAL